MTPTDVLNIFIEQHRLCSPLDFEADPYVELDFDSTIEEWSDANDLLGWRKLYPFLNDSFQIDVSEEDWKNALTPSSKKKLKDVCELISKYSKHKNIEPIKLLGSECLSAAIFLTLKKYLQRRDVDVSDLKPSSPIEPYLDKYFSEMVEQITIVSKGKKVFEKFEVSNTGLLNIFKKSELLTGEIRTFRDVSLKIVAVSQN
ncbi:hypothetical protein [Flavobacterium sp.]|uniref:hypothetical protein n=1 Tax=Flavobacterium sp. TaxID=239 RepID=UPI0039E52CB5